MVGSFMVPVAYVAFFYERRHLSRLTLPTVSLAFLYGGLVGIVAASFLEPIFIRHLDFVSFLKVGFIEEFAKILGVVVIARYRRHDSEMDGLI
jgi:protease PrsW